MAKSKWLSEAHFQESCYKWYMKTMPPEEWGRLIGIYNNPQNISQLISMGLRPGISDFLYFPGPSSSVSRSDWDSMAGDQRAFYHNFTLIVPPAWIELKILGGKQNKSQLVFEPMVKGWGHRYHLITEEITDFQNLILKLRQNG